ncbi:hypothetical protein ACFWBI_07950 [Streptomyces sp. NPDC059982]|uniref:hypothetical protein n=1 Tax=unclassified Streptomyces TaxID=2593676 RepID=UPI0036C27908
MRDKLMVDQAFALVNWHAANWRNLLGSWVRVVLRSLPEATRRDIEVKPMSRLSTSPIPQATRSALPAALARNSLAVRHEPQHPVLAEAAEAILVEVRVRQRRRLQQTLAQEVADTIKRADRLIQVVDQSAAREPIHRVTVQLMRLIKEMIPAAEAALSRSPHGRERDILRGTIDHSRSILLQSDAGTMKSMRAQLTLLSGSCRLLVRYQVDQ